MASHRKITHFAIGASFLALALAAGATMMEAARILKAVGVQPRRTIRVALWSGEEQGLLGSKAYVEEHFAKRAEPKDPEQAKLPAFARTTDKGELTIKPDQAKVSAYFNVDNGTGKIRGIYAQENAAVAPIFAEKCAKCHTIARARTSALVARWHLIEENGMRSSAN